MTYDTRPYIDPVPRLLGWHDVRARVTWTPRGGVPNQIDGAFLDANEPDGPITMGCGIEAAVEALGLWSTVGDHVLAICELADAQLAERPWAEVVCREGQARLELIRV